MQIYINNLSKEQKHELVQEFMSDLVFLTPSNDYEKLTAQVDFLGNHSLASDMRSITLSDNMALKVITGVLAVMFLVVVVPLIIWISWMLRERRNGQKRIQMMNSAKSFIQSTPVPETKIQLIEQLQMNG